MKCTKWFKIYEEMYLENTEYERKNRSIYLMKRKTALRTLKKNGIQVIYFDSNKDE
jgi:hypothetical protein